MSEQHSSLRLLVFPASLSVLLLAGAYSYTMVAESKRADIKQAAELVGEERGRLLASQNVSCQWDGTIMRDTDDNIYYPPKTCSGPLAEMLKLVKKAKP